MAGLLNPPPKSDQHRPMAVGVNGMVASAEPLAASAGLQVLMEGGNAFDAAITAAFVEDVTLPAMTSLGGDLFALLYDAKTKEIHSIIGSGGAPARASIDWFMEKGLTSLPADGILSCSVPGEVHALYSIHQRFCSMPLERLLQPAITYAEHGVPVNERLHWRIANSEKKLRRNVAASAIFLPDGRPPRVGSLLYQKDLAKTLRRLAVHGLLDFYQGAVAEQIGRHISEAGGHLTREDLERHETEFASPISTTYRGWTIYETPPPSQGLTVLESLNILSGYDLAGWGLDSPDLIHHMVETKKIAYSDRLRYCGDPRFVTMDANQLISQEHAERQRKNIHPDRVMEHRRGIVEYIDGDTTYLAVVDRDGNCVSLIHSLSGVEFGSGVVAGNTGIVLNSRLGRGFSIDPNSPNALLPGKRTMHTLNTYLIFSGDQPCYVGGTPGGDQQPQWNLQVIVNLLDFNLNVQEAAEHPRWFSFPGTDEIHLDQPFVLRMEKRFRDELYRALEAKGHRVQVIGPWGGGGVQLIQIDRHHGTYLGGSDPRIGGVALGY